MDEIDIFIEALRENHDRAQAKNKERYKLFLEQAEEKNNNEPTNIYPETTGL